MEAFLRSLLPRLLPDGRTFEVHPFQGKGDLLGKLEQRLRAYASWLPENWRIVVIVDRDHDDCLALKRVLEEASASAGLRSRTAVGPKWQVVNRIAVEELEAWYFGDWDAVCLIYPRVPSTIPARAAFRDPDSVPGGTWEAFERVLRQSGSIQGNLPKIETARLLGRVLDPKRNRSLSFRQFYSAVTEAVT